MMKILVRVIRRRRFRRRGISLKQQGLDVTCAFMRNWDSMANNDFLGNRMRTMTCVRRKGLDGR